MLRCLQCGSSRLDSQGMRCALCGGTPGVSSEQVYVSDATKAKLRAHEAELDKFGLILQEYEGLRKGVDLAKTIELAIVLADSMKHGVLGSLIRYLRKIKIPRDEILQLRLCEPEEVD